MNEIFIIEIPAGSDRRTHLNYAKTEFIDCGPIIEKITANNGLMPTAYGFLKGVINTDEAGESEEYLDAIDISDIVGTTGDKISVVVVGMFEREDGDHKVLIARHNMEFAGLPKELQNTLLEFHGFNKKITKIYSADEARQYVENCKHEKTGSNA